jgi:hypothetical protein
MTPGNGGQQVRVAKDRAGLSLQVAGPTVRADKATKLRQLTGDASTAARAL